MNHTYIHVTSRIYYVYMNKHINYLKRPQETCALMPVMFSPLSLSEDHIDMPYLKISSCNIWIYPLILDNATRYIIYITVKLSINEKVDAPELNYLLIILFKCGKYAY